MFHQYEIQISSLQYLQTFQICYTSAIDFNYFNHLNTQKSNCTHDQDANFMKLKVNEFACTSKLTHVIAPNK